MNSLIQECFGIYEKLGTDAAINFKIDNDIKVDIDNFQLDKNSVTSIQSGDEHFSEHFRASCEIEIRDGRTYYHNIHDAEIHESMGDTLLYLNEREIRDGHTYFVEADLFVLSMNYVSCNYTVELNMKFNLINSNIFFDVTTYLQIDVTCNGGVYLDYYGNHLELEVVLKIPSNEIFSDFLESVFDFNISDQIDSIKQPRTLLNDLENCLQEAGDQKQFSDCLSRFNYISEILENPEPYIDK